MNKKFNKIIDFCLCFSIILGCILPVYAQADSSKKENQRELHITTVDEFLAFAENCILDSYSQNLTVYLDNDINLSEKNFNGIPIFCGTFIGNNHTISNINISVDGSAQGFFRYITSTATVENLNISGNVSPNGSRGSIGGIVGSNSGKIINCTFEGSIAGNDKVGGISGINTVSGIIDGCNSKGSINGKHFVGGIVGENNGTVRNCTNSSEVNITADENSVELSDVNVNTLVGTEDANTVTDIGGIAGTSNGVIRSCTNNSTIGYKHMGYNIGGIVGSQMGYIVDCKNYGDIYGRKEVGGIAGQMEPISNIKFSRDTLQILQGQLSNASALANQASVNAQNSASALNGQLSDMHNNAGVALDSIDQLIPKIDGEIPDKDSITAAQNALNSSITSMQGNMSNISASTNNAVNTMVGDIKAINNQINSITHTIGNASDNLGVKITDISDKDTNDNLTGKIELSINNGYIFGDLNTGGIVGAIAMENDLDHEDDFQFSGKESLNLEGEMRAVVLNCKNTATVSAKKRQSGGIVGFMPLGLVKNCLNTGILDSTSAKYVGGISGNSSGYIRNSSAKCELFGSSFVGGIAGKATVVSDCRSMIKISDSKEKSGAILGFQETNDNQDKNPIKNNFYFITNTDLGGIDGISYDGMAQSLSYDDFLSMPDLDQVFLNSTITFTTDDGDVTTISVNPGDALNGDDIPKVPEKTGYTGEWENLKNIDTSNIYFDLNFKPLYKPYSITVQSKLSRDNGIPVVLAQGQFSNSDCFDITKFEQTPDISEKETLIECWSVPTFSDNLQTQLRYAYPKEYNTKELKVMVRDVNGKWNTVKHSVNGSYIVFPLNPSDNAFCVLNSPNPYKFIIYIPLSFIAVLSLIFIYRIIKRKKNKSNIENTATVN